METLSYMHITMEPQKWGCLVYYSPHQSSQFLRIYHQTCIRVQLMALYTEQRIGSHQQHSSSTIYIVAQSKVVNTLIAYCVGVSKYRHSHSVVIPMQ